jgi:hypothetical protein
MDKDYLPVGFAMSLAMNEKAMSAYAGLSHKDRKKLISQSRKIKSKEEMQKFVERLTER